MQKYEIEEFEEFVKVNSEEKYRDFHSHLIKTHYVVNGIRIPVLRKYAKDIAKSRDITDFLLAEPKCYEQCMFKGILLSYLKEKDDKFFEYLEIFLSEIDDWSLVDVASCGIHRKDDIYLAKIVEYAASENVWFARWGLVAILINFCDKDDIIYGVVDNIVAQDYYVDMALAWLIQVLAVKNRQVAVNLLSGEQVGAQVKKLALRKIKDSFRISNEEKEYFEQIIKG